MSDSACDFFTAVQRRAELLDTRLCVGLDPHPEFVRSAEELVPWALGLVEATAPYAACFKVNIAFFEAFGAEGMRALEALAPQVQSYAPVLLDAKRGDISSTADAYACAAFERWGAHGLTVSPYLGVDSVTPYLRYPQAGLFVLCHTSNPGAAELQTRRDEQGTLLYEAVIDMIERSGEGARVGYVVGATQPDALSSARRRAPNAWLLCPGVGAQGGDLKELIDRAWGEEGRVLVATSRAIARATNPGAEARSIRDAIREAAQGRSEPKHEPKRGPTAVSELASALLETGCVLFGAFTLKSGLTSPIYLDLRRLVSSPRAFEVALQAYHHKLKALQASRSFDALAGLPLAGLPIATGLAMRARLPLCYPRPPKKHGTGRSVEGSVRQGQRLLMIDDLATRGVSALEALEPLREHGEVSDLLVLIDRESGAGAQLAQEGVTLHSVVSMSALLDEWEASGAVEPSRLEEVRAFLRGGHG